MRRMNATETTMRCVELWMAVPLTKSARRNPMGSMRSAIVAPTIWIGTSRSVRSTFLPAWRFPAAIAASRMPTAIGLRILMSVHTDAIAMTPAPMNLTWSMKTLLTASSDAVADSSPHTMVGRSSLPANAPCR